MEILLYILAWLSLGVIGTLIGKFVDFIASIIWEDKSYDNPFPILSGVVCGPISLFLAITGLLIVLIIGLEYRLYKRKFK